MAPAKSNEGNAKARFDDAPARLRKVTKVTGDWVFGSTSGIVAIADLVGRMFPISKSGASAEIGHFESYTIGAL